MVIDTSLLNTQHYKVCIMGKVEQYREISSVLPLHLSVVATEKGAFELPSTMVTNFTYLLKKNNNKNFINRVIGHMSRVFANGPGDWGSIPDRSYQRLKKWYLMLSCSTHNIIWTHRIWTRRYEFNSWTRLIAFHIALIPLGKV